MNTIILKTIALAFATMTLATYAEEAPKTPPPISKDAKLVAVLAVAFTLCHRWGARTESREEKKIKKHGHRARSVFRIGFESMHEFVKRPQHFADRIKEFILQVIMLPQREIFVG